MREVDPGHEYLLDSYDGPQENRLIFMKREGEGYPFNVGHHPGTNCQEVIRVLIARVKYLQRQIPCDENLGALCHLRGALMSFEWRAARRHGRVLHLPSDGPPFCEIEELPTCATCGHVQCTAHANATPDPASATSVEGELLPCPKCGHTAKRSLGGFCNEVVPGGHCWCKCAPSPATAEQTAREMGQDTNFPLSDTLTLMVEWLRHLHDDHNCDCHGWEQRSFLIEAAERYRTAIQSSVGTPSLPVSQEADQQAKEVARKILLLIGETFAFCLETRTEADYDAIAEAILPWLRALQSNYSAGREAVAPSPSDEAIQQAALEITEQFDFADNYDYDDLLKRITAIIRKHFGSVTDIAL